MKRFLHAVLMALAIFAGSVVLAILVNSGEVGIVVCFVLIFITMVVAFMS